MMPLLAASGSATTPAGSIISNTARITVAAADGDRTGSSNQVDLIVAERLDVLLTRVVDDAPAVGGAGTLVWVTATNTGNGNEAYRVTAAPNDSTIIVRAVAVDRDGDGRFDPARDDLLALGVTPPVPAGGRVDLLVILDPHSGAVTAPSLTIGVAAITGSGSPGAVFAGRGDNGGDAVTGQTGATATVTVPLTTEARDAPGLTKAQSVLAPDGSTRAMPGAIITYTLTARFPGAADAVRIADPIPSGTTYVPGSLRLDTAPLSDVPDDDAGSADAAGVAIGLGNVPAAVTRLIQFQVKIQ